ncbi:phiSA1p31-related protein [Streptomyces fractus]|uniref:phiSA1p31-related protein n=1 Tax=Streptomyces fractus TaxID=641806 RepID=UPI003CFAB29E
MTEFKVGQKVRHNIYGDVEIAFGPVDFMSMRGGYVVDKGDGEHGVVSSTYLSAIPEPQAFAIGDTVTAGLMFGGAPAELVAGPYTSRLSGMTFWVAERNGQHACPREALLTKVAKPKIKVGDRVRVVKDDELVNKGVFVGLTGVIARLNPPTRRLPYTVRFDAGQGARLALWNVAEVELVDDAATYTHDGVTYDLTAKYSDGDEVWEFTGKYDANGVPRVTAYGNADNIDTIADIADDYGPLTRI